MSESATRERGDRTKETVEAARATPGGHLSIGPYGATLHFGNARLSGFDEEPMKTACIAAGVPVIDSRKADRATADLMEVGGPMVAVNRDVVTAGPHGALSYVPLRVLATAKRSLGYDVHNVDDDPATARWFRIRAGLGSLELARCWLDEIRTA